MYHTINIVALCLVAFAITANAQLPDGVYKITYQGPGKFKSG